MTSALRLVPSARETLVPGASDVWRTPDLDRVVRALNVWRVGAGDFLTMAADPGWPAFPGAQIVAALVTAAERSAPGCRAALVSWSPGAPASARRSLRLRVDVVHRGAAGDVTARITVDQRDSPRGPRRAHGSAVVLLTPDGPAVASRSPSAGRADVAAPAIVPATAVPAGLDATTSRAFLAYVGAALTVPPGYTAYPSVPGGAGAAVVLASTIAFLGPVEAGSVPRRLGGASAGGHAQAMTEFRTSEGALVAQISQAVLLS